MSNFLQFSAATSVKNLFGKDLVTDQIAAVFELVKNSYDADAKAVNIVFSGLKTDSPTLTIYDDGTGMDLKDIRTKWMVIGTDSKKKALLSPIFKRTLNGDKGIGRFSVDRLGACLNLESKKRGSNECFSIYFDWTVFDGDAQNINEIKIPYKKKQICHMEHGVSLNITGLRDLWDEKKIKDLYKSLRKFKSPFAQEDNFRIYITATDYGFDKKEVMVEKIDSLCSLWIDVEVKDNDQSVVYMSINKDGLEYELVEHNKFSFGSIKARVLVFNQGDKIRFFNRYNLRVRDYGNIRLYRDDFRIHPYGESDNDWLSLDRRQTQGLLRTLGTRDIIGYVQITKKYNEQLKPLTNRQGLEDNASFRQLREFIIQNCIKTLETYHFSFSKKSINETIEKTKLEIGTAVSGLDKLAINIKKNNPEVSKQIQAFAKTIKHQQKTQLQYVQDQQEIVKVYSRIAQKETFLHKLIHQSMIHVNDAKTAMEYVIETITGVSNEDKKQLIAAQNYIADALSLLKTVRDDVVKKRSKAVQNIEKIVQKYINENKAYFAESKVAVNLTSKGDLNYNADLGDIKAIVNNLVTNSIKSLNKVFDRPRELKIELYKTDKFIIIRCIDNGIGIREEDREKIFDPFHTSTDGFGLGLTIIDEIAKEYNGALELIETPIGACFSVKLRCENV